MQRPHRAARCDHPWTTVSRLGDLGLSAREPAASVVRSVLVVTHLSRSPLSRFAAPLLLALACPAAGGGPDPCRGRTPPPAPPWERPPGGGDLAQVPEPCASGTHGHGPGRRLVRPMVHAVSGFTNKSLRRPGRRPARRGLHQRTDDLRPASPAPARAITRRPGTHTYITTLQGLRVAAFYTKLGDRVLGPLLAADHPPAPIEVRRALATLDRAVGDYVTNARLGTAA